jgi:hypothetical protein
MLEKLRVAMSAVVVLLALLACKNRKVETDDPTVASAVATAVAVPSTAAPPAASASSAPDAGSPAASTSAAKAPGAKCKGLMLHKRCAKECGKDDDCSDPKERCESFSGFDDSGENVQGAMVCVYDANNTPRAAKPALPNIGAPLVNGDCAKGWVPSVKEANKCDKSCNADGECGAGNVCKAVGPVGIGKQCQPK